MKNTFQTVITLLLCLLLSCGFISCAAITDIEYTEKEKTSSTVSGQTSSDEYYSLSEKESNDEYGIFSLPLRTSYDGEYIYKLKQMQIESAAEYKRVQYSFLYKTTLENPEKEISVCEDPLCGHTPGSGCPFDGIESLPVIFKGRLYFTTLVTFSDDSGDRTTAEICRFDAKTNKKIVIDRSDRKIILRKDSEEELYYYKDIELEEFVFSRECWRIKDNDTSYFVSICGEPSGTLPDMRYSYADRYQVYSKSVIAEDGYTYYTAIYDAENKEEHVLFSSSGENALNAIFAVNNAFGKYLLIDRSEKSDGGTTHQCGLLDIETLYERSFLSYNESDAMCVFLSYSDKCIEYIDPRTSEDQPLILHVLYPASGREETFDLSAAFGIALPLDLSIRPVERGAVKLCVFVQGDDMIPTLEDLYEIDLPSGRTRILSE